MTALYNITLFLAQLFFSFCMFIILLRIMLQLFGINSGNPICQLIAKISNPIVLPVRKIFPRVRTMDTASVVVLCLLEFIKLGLVAWLQGVSISIIPLLLAGFVDLVLQVLDFFFYAILIRVLLSWLSGVNNPPLQEILWLITEPILGRIRRFIPSIAGFDLSPIVAFVGIKIITIALLSYV